jgi:ABC-type transporter MlaC component
LHFTVKQVRIIDAREAKPILEYSMKQLTLKALFLSGVAAFSMNAQAASVYDQCLSDAAKLIEVGISGGLTAAKQVQQSTTIEQCKAELTAMETKYENKWHYEANGKKYVRAPYSVMTPEDREKWATLFNAIDTKNYMGVRFLLAVYYRQ